jgi:hypothetical protein
MLEPSTGIWSCDSVKPGAGLVKSGMLDDNDDDDDDDDDDAAAWLVALVVALCIVVVGVDVDDDDDELTGTGGDNVAESDAALYGSIMYNVLVVGFEHARRHSNLS